MSTKTQTTTKTTAAAKAESVKKVEEKRTRVPVYTKDGRVLVVGDKVPFKVGEKLLVEVNGSKVIITKAPE